MSCDWINDRVQRWWIKLQNSPAIWRSLILLGIYILVGVALEEVGDILQASWQVQPWQPAAGWNVVLLFGFGLRYIPALSIAPLLQEVLFQAQNRSLIITTISSVCTAIFYGLASAWLLYKSDIDPRLSRSDDVVKFVVVFTLASLVLASCKMGSLMMLGEIELNQWSIKTMHEWAGEATGIAMLAPPLLVLLRRFPWSGKRLNLRGSQLEIDFCLPEPQAIRNWLGLLAATILFTWAAHGGIQSPGLDYTYLTFIPLVFTCAWKGFESATVIILSINVTAVIFISNSLENTDTLALQFGLMTVTYTGLLLGAFVSANTRESAKRQELEQQLRYDATHDSLTGLYNRGWFLDRLNQIINKVNKNENYLFALLFLDLDRFKTINDSFGHLVGDLLLMEIAQKLRQCLPESTSIVRLGGDEFTIILENLSNISQVRQTADTVCQSLSQNYLIDGYEIFTTISMGIALGSRDSQPADLLRNADIALYEAKTRGRSQYVVFDRQMYERVAMQAKLERDLRQAVNELD
ncbi:sensor domain-containing diguanylate cyclase [Pleurocapsales cyanobacterium LEGE 10410]|nr:sensor domain-containing diguanylate cyclase [Pleurocapsales cyanobacterium LEGE 10410]